MKLSPAQIRVLLLLRDKRPVLSGHELRSAHALERLGLIRYRGWHHYELTEEGRRTAEALTGKPQAPAAGEPKETP